jgi:hypothetical protein
MTYHYIIQVRNLVWPSVVCVSTLENNYVFSRSENPNPTQYGLCPKEAIFSITQIMLFVG